MKKVNFFEIKYYRKDIEIYLYKDFNKDKVNFFFYIEREFCNNIKNTYILILFICKKFDFEISKKLAYEISKKVIEFIKEKGL